VVPDAIGAHPPNFSGVVEPQYLTVDRTTSPALLNVPPGKVWLIADYPDRMSIPVVDQFGNLLSNIYNGASVSEEQPINAQVNDGYYSDPVGPFAFYAEVDAQSKDAMSWPTGVGNKDAYDLELTPRNMAPDNNIKENSVYVGGFSLWRSHTDHTFPALKRALGWTTVNGVVTVTIEWR
jgi:hypothetical protein